jgi:hypothetical protein
MFVRAADVPTEIGGAWAELEQRLDSLRGRKFYGAFDSTSEEYRACVQLQDGDDPAGFGLELGAPPGGTYVRTRIRGEPPDVYEQIAPTFRALAQIVAPDETRPSLEFYRRRDEIDLLMPVRG